MKKNDKNYLDHEIEKIIEERIKWSHFWEILNRRWVSKLIVISMMLLMVLSNVAGEDAFDMISKLIRLILKKHP